MGARYIVRANGAGGYSVVQRRDGKECRIGFDCSHRSNAAIKAARLNGERDQGQDWRAFYRA